MKITRTTQKEEILEHIPQKKKAVNYDTAFHSSEDSPGSEIVPARGLTNL